MTAEPLDIGAERLGEAVRAVYQTGQTDYSLEPLVRVDAVGAPVGRISNGDSVVFCCRRGEREVELTEAFTSPDFPHFERPDLSNLEFVILTLYHEKFKDLPVAFAPINIPETLGEAVSRAGKKQLRIAESEKFAHVTFFLNGGQNQPFPGEEDIRILSPKGIAFDQVPELRLPLVADEVLKGISGGVELIITNFANGDVIGHTSNASAKIKCAEIIDHHLERVVQAAWSAGYVVVIAADHGNLEVLYTADGSPHVAHTSNPVPFFLIDPQCQATIRPADGCLADIAPTLLEILGISQPVKMTGASLLPGHAWGADRHALVIILDGWGIGASDDSNPIFLANTPFWDRLLSQYPHSRLAASGQLVGLQAGKPGNSEAGHMNIGAGRIVLQDDIRLDSAMQDGSFYSNGVILKAIQDAKNRNKNLHLIGMLSEKSSHGSIEYPLAILRMARDCGLSQAFVHLIFDGRSTEPGSIPAALIQLEERMSQIGIGQVVSGMGRGIALDRDGNYGKIKRAFDALVSGIGTPYKDINTL